MIMGSWILHKLVGCTSLGLSTDHLSVHSVLDKRLGVRLGDVLAFLSVLLYSIYQSMDLFVITFSPYPCVFNYLFILCV